MGNDTNEPQSLEEGGPDAPRYFERQSRCFPFEPFKLLPGHVKIFIPGTLQKIQDWTHLVLVFGVVACTALVFQTVYSLTYGRCDEGGYCLKEALAIFCIAPCTIYCFRIIGQYDDRLQAKQKQAKQEKESMKKTYNALLSEMDGLLGKAAESSTGLAERSFESKRRDFQRFLERAKNKFHHFSGQDADKDLLLHEFRRFCINWLHVFAECSIDPINHPKVVVDAKELEDCATIADVAELCLRQLRTTEVQFITIQREKDAQLVKRLTAGWLNGPRSRNLALTEGAARDAQPSAMPNMPRDKGRRRRVSWVQVGRTGFHAGAQAGAGTDGYPKEFSCGCGRLVVLSCEHATLIAGFLVTWLLLLHSLSGRHFTLVPILAITEVFVAQVCFAVLLYRFEELDIIQQLNREVRELAKQNKHVQQQRENMREFWSNAQQLTELWLYRTVPRLDLYKELHEKLEDTPQDELITNLEATNRNLENLEDKLSELKAWRNDGAISLGAKKDFGGAINDLCRDHTFDDICRKLGTISLPGLDDRDDGIVMVSPRAAAGHV